MDLIKVGISLATWLLNSLQPPQQTVVVVPESALAGTPYALMMQPPIGVAGRAPEAGLGWIELLDPSGRATPRVVPDLQGNFSTQLPGPLDAAGLDRALAPLGCSSSARTSDPSGRYSSVFSALSSAGRMIAANGYSQPDGQRVIELQGMIHSSSQAIISGSLDCASAVNAGNLSPSALNTLPVQVEAGLMPGWNAVKLSLTFGPRGAAGLLQNLPMQSWSWITPDRLRISLNRY